MNYNIDKKSNFMRIKDEYENGIITEKDLPEEAKNILIEWYAVDNMLLLEGIEKKKAELYKKYAVIKNKK